jgi:phosphoribosylaminoimidazole-succinocarboxamide synthase
MESPTADTRLYELHRPALSSPAFDTYDLGEQLLLVASDRVALGGRALPGLIPNKGKALAQMAIYWYELLGSVVGSSFVSADVGNLPQGLAALAEGLEGRSLLLSKVEELPLEAVVYGYLTADVADEYLAHGTVGGVESEPGVKRNGRLPQSIYIPFELDASGRPARQSDLMETIGRLGTRHGMVLCSNALDIYEITAGLALSRGLVLAEMRLRFGLADGQVVVAAPITPDDSPCWLAEGYEPGRGQQEFILGPLLDWWAGLGDEVAALPDADLPEPPEGVLAEVGRRYVQACEMATAEGFWG